MDGPAPGAGSHYHAAVTDAVEVGTGGVERARTAFDGAATLSGGFLLVTAWRQIVVRGTPTIMCLMNCSRYFY